ncbi:hypothetical protein BJY16_001321 [Actinoplanes octamycinicus]|uniref:Uncharacterized protein n=1 Tax=Actinoplanes octamycinicus TaxID=135948 RepID=A0A7W7GTA0_9ACTN|nr:hypothetical protein [Actinoplanes octamycinicus]MBB4737862.1 hypothetical protein [Actinoplanes octamycinicus]GIE59086.1 hypothetical protein Aoc01nite_44880 [Actinoplanes octamycinicus]
MTKKKPAEPAAAPEPAAPEPAPETAPAAPAPDAAAAAPAPDAAPAASTKTTDFVPGPGGVMTDEVGVVTGDLTLRSELAGDQLTLRVQYKDAEEWYTVTGGKAKLADPSDLDAVHQIVIGLLDRPEAE